VFDAPPLKGAFAMDMIIIAIAILSITSMCWNGKLRGLRLAVVRHTDYNQMYTLTATFQLNSFWRQTAALRTARKQVGPFELNVR
jgi:hypothetical protein